MTSTGPQDGHAGFQNLNPQPVAVALGAMPQGNPGFAFEPATAFGDINHTLINPNDNTKVAHWVVPAQRRRVRRAQRVTAGPVLGMKRPLNSWMAFRAYYSTGIPEFTELQQKDISGFMTCLWNADPFKAKWAIVAKAYSTVRDSVSKEDAPLDVFLAIAAPVIGLIPPEEYLMRLGWHLLGNENLDMFLNRHTTPDPSSFGDRFRTTNLSAADVVKLCVKEGYMPPPDDSELTTSTPTSMAMAAQPTSRTSNTVKAAKISKTRTPKCVGKTPQTMHPTIVADIPQPTNTLMGSIDATDYLDINSIAWPSSDELQQMDAVFPSTLPEPEPYQPLGPPPDTRDSDRQRYAMLATRNDGPAPVLQEWHPDNNDLFTHDFGFGFGFDANAFDISGSLV